MKYFYTDAIYVLHLQAKYHNTVLSHQKATKHQTP